MSLVQFKPNFRLPQNNFVATPSTSLWGTRLTVGGTVHTKGSYAQVTASLNYDIEGFFITLAGVTSNGTAPGGLMDIAIGAAASEQIVIADMLIGGPNAQGGFVVQSYWIPLRIPAGTRVSARWQANSTTRTVETLWTFFGGSNSPPYPVYTGVDILGTDTSTSSGVSHTAGNSGAESAWASLGATTPRAWKAVQLLVGSPLGAALTNVGYHFEIGYSSTTLAEFFVGAATNEQTVIFPWGAIPMNIPAGTQMQIRGEASASAQALDFALMGFY